MGNINELGQIAHEINKANGWEVFSPNDWGPSLDQVRFLSTHMALVHTEVSEATEAIRHQDHANFAEELADVFIRVSSIAHGLGIDLETEVRKKLTKNQGRGFRHGGKAV